MLNQKGQAQPLASMITGVEYKGYFLKGEEQWEEDELQDGKE